LASFDKGEENTDLAFPTSLVELTELYYAAQFLELEYLRSTVASKMGATPDFLKFPNVRRQTMDNIDELDLIYVRMNY